MGKIQTAVQIAKQEGPKALVRTYYKHHLWPRLPALSDHAIYNEVRVDKSHMSDGKICHRLGDTLVPWHTPGYIPDYKQPNVQQLVRHCRPGDSVLTIGGGDGVTAVRAAWQVGDRGNVRIYDADGRRIRDLKRTLKHNDVNEWCECIHAIVGPPHNVKAISGANEISPADLPACNVLEMDCEGSEFAILKNLEIKPRVVIAELHYEYDFSTYESPQAIRELLSDLGYTVERYDHRSVNALLVGY